MTQGVKEEEKIVGEGARNPILNLYFSSKDGEGV